MASTVAVPTLGEARLQESHIIQNLVSTSCLSLDERNEKSGTEGSVPSNVIKLFSRPCVLSLIETNPNRWEEGAKGEMLCCLDEEPSESFCLSLSLQIKGDWPAVTQTMCPPLAMA